MLWRFFSWQCSYPCRSSVKRICAAFFRLDCVHFGPCLGFDIESLPPEPEGFQKPTVDIHSIIGFRSGPLRGRCLVEPTGPPRVVASPVRQVVTRPPAAGCRTCGPWVEAMGQTTFVKAGVVEDRTKLYIDNSFLSPKFGGIPSAARRSQYASNWSQSYFGKIGMAHGSRTTRCGALVDA